MFIVSNNGLTIMQTFVTFTLCTFLLKTAVLRIKMQFSGDLHLGIYVDVDHIAIQLSTFRWEA